jgi:pSer/pThr/pTyr-binding forkhead associated (FHA) protein
MAVKLQVVLSIPGKEPREFEYEFDETRISIGRDQDNEIQVPLSTVSRKHCVLFRDGDEWYLEDLRSTHGTKHNGRPVGAGGKKLLRDGDTVDLIHFKISFHNRERVSPDYSVEKTEALARKMVEEVLASIGRDGGDVPYLRVMNGPDEGKRFPIGVDIAEAVVGRGNDCDFQVNDVNISRRHAMIRRDWNEITVEDAGSKNGVELNGRKIARPTPLRDADELLLGAVRLTFIDPSAKFIGKLDDIPAFADAATGLDDDTAGAPGGDGEGDEGDEGDAAVADARDDGNGDVGEADGGEPGLSDGDEPVRDAQAATMGGVVDDSEPDPFDDEPPPPRGLGTFEIVLIAGAVVAVLGLAAGVAVLVIGS